MTTSIAEPRPQQSPRPVLLPLADVLPAPARGPLEPLPAAASPVADPTASVLAERVLRAAVEILGGRRSAHQLSTMVRPDVLAQLITQQEVARHLTPQIHKVMAHPQPPGALEAVAVVTLSTGVRALAARFEEHLNGGRRQWQCTALQLRLTAGDLATHPRRRSRRP